MSGTAPIIPDIGRELSYAAERAEQCHKERPGSFICGYAAGMLAGLKRACAMLVPRDD